MPTLNPILTNISLRLPIELVQRVNELSQATGRSRTFYMQEAIKAQIDDLEDLYLAEQRLIDIRAGRSQTHSLEEVERRLGLAD